VLDILLLIHILRYVRDDTVSGVKMQESNPPMANHATNDVRNDKRINVNKFHEILCHCGVGRLRKTAFIHELKLKGDVKLCEDCAIAKARQENLNKE
jgi:hypothetical protein